MSTSLTEYPSTKHLEYSQREIPATKSEQYNDEPQNIPLTDPLERIALCLSGGGYRAAAFSLGTMAYLHSVNFKGKSLLDRVCLISSTSGGSITCLAYAVDKANNGGNFPQLQNVLFKKLAGESLIDHALTILNDGKNWKGSKKRTLINAFAIAYDRYLFNGARFEKLASLKSADLRICVNATEFYRGLTFRFQNFGYIGNRYINLDKNQLATINSLKVADILAASSCFPVGFEPIEYPRDFAHDQLTTDKLRAIASVFDYNNNATAVKSIPLMDGGITDNQGIYSAIVSDLNARKNNRPPVSLFIVTDVASYFMDHYEAPVDKQGLLRRSSLSVLYLAVTALGIAGLWAVLMLLRSPSSIYALYGGALLLFPSLFITGWVIFDLLSNAVKRFILKKEAGFGVLKSLFQIKNFSDEILKKLYDYLRKTRVGVLEQMIKNRLSSSATMLLDINLKQVRRLINDIFYSNDLFEDRRCTNYIYEYSAQNFTSKSAGINKRKKWSQADKNIMLPSSAMRAVAETAREMGTTLWFDSDDRKQEKLEKLVACGRFTVCGSLLEYVLDLKYNPQAWNILPPNTQQEIQALEKQLREDWQKFLIDPMQAQDR